MKGRVTEPVVCVDQGPLFDCFDQGIEVVRDNGLEKVRVDRIDDFLTEVMGDDFPTLQVFVPRLEHPDQLI